MPLRRDHIAWSKQELARCAALTGQGYSAEATAQRLNAEFHDGKPVRSEPSVKMVRQKHRLKVGPKPSTPLPDLPGRETEQEVGNGDGDPRRQFLHLGAMVTLGLQTHLPQTGEDAPGLVFLRGEDQQLRWHGGVFHGD